jgi:autotransporter-associated beta strand protein
MTGTRILADLTSYNLAYVLGGLTGSTNINMGAGTSGGGSGYVSIGNNSRNTTYSGALSGSAGLTKIGTGTLVLSGINSYTGGTRVNDGTLTALNGNNIPNTGTVTLANVASAYLNIAGSETIGPLSGGGATGGTVLLSANTLTISNNVTTTFAGIISGTGGALIKTGTGKQVLSGNNSYTGSTDVNGGTLIINGTHTSATTVNSATLGGTGTISVGALTLTNGTTLAIEIAGTSSYDIVAGTGAIDLGGATLSLSLGTFTPTDGNTFTIMTGTITPSQFASGLTVIGLQDDNTPYTFDIAYNPTSVVLSFGVIPEPSTWALVAMALVPLFLRRRR